MLLVWKKSKIKVDICKNILIYEYFKYEWKNYDSKYIKEIIKLFYYYK